MSEGLLSQFDPEAVGSVPEPTEPVETSSLLSAYDPDAVGVLPPESTATGAFVRGAERGLLPSLGGFAAAGAGAELGALAGAAAGPAGAVVGGLAGGLAGAIGGGSLVAAAQNYALSKAPESWVEKLGQDERQQQLDEAQHPYASFLGGVAPFVLTMRPGAAPKIALPENATAVQRLMANPATARIFGGGAMGGMELGSELLSGDAPDWTKVGISTGMGLVLNRQTKLGEYLTNMGARPFRPATVAEAHDMKVMGPGVTESVFRGAHELDPESARTASEIRRAEMEVLGEVSPATPDIHGLARKADPELFARYDELTATRDDLRNWLEQYRNPDFGQIDVAMQAMEDARKAYDAHVEAAKGYTGGPEARKLRAGIREAEKAYDLLFARRRDFAKGQFAETPESAKVRERLMAVDLELRDMGRDVASAYRRAAEFGGGDMVEPAAPMVEEPAAPRNAFGGLLPLAEGERPAVAPTEAGMAPAAPEARPAMALAEQKAAIADDVAQQLIAAGRPDAEARAAGQLIAERYATRAARFDGKLGSALELYNREGARIRGAGGAAAPATVATSPSEKPIQLPPVKDGFVRFYHGAKNAEKPGEGRWVTTSYEYARDWNRGDAPNSVWYVDIPETAPQLKNWIEDNSSSGLPRKSWPSPPHFEAPFEYMRDARPANAAPAIAPSEPVAPVPMEDKPVKASDFGKVAKPEKEISLLEFLSMKGLAPSPELTAVFDKENPRYGKTGLVKQGGEKLIREGGRTLDDALRAAVEARYFHDAGMGEGELNLTPSDLLDAIRAEHFGDKLYPSDKGAFANLAAAEKESKAYRAEMRAERQRVLDSMPLGGWEDDFLTTVDGKNTLDRAADYLRTGEETNPRAAWDRSYEDYQIEQIRAAEPVEYQASPLDEFWQSKLDWTPGGGAKEAKFGPATIEYGVARDGKSTEVILLNVPASERGKGAARAAMEAFLSAVDAEGKTVFLNSEPMGKGGLSKAALNKFYKSLGFVKNTGKNKDFTSTAEFVRQPSKVEPIRLNGEGDVSKVETGKPVTFKFRHNTESATQLFGIPDKDAPYGRGYEPSGRYVSVAEESEPFGKQGKIVVGELTFRNPLVVENNGLQWKKTLSNQYGGKTGKELSKALIADGYDGVITTEKSHISEVLDLTTFKESKAFYQRNSQTETEAFKKWFGESKVVGKDGEPLVVYHGTKSDIIKFDRRKSNINKSFFFSEDANFSGSNAYTGYIDENSGGNIIPVYLRIENPLILEKMSFNPMDEADVISKAKSQGYDGINVKSDGRWISFEPKHIKSAIGNRGTFSLNSPKILEQSAKGKITFRPGQKPIITLMRDADASTFIHETGHDFLEQMIRDAKHEAAPDILKEDAQTIRNWLGVKADAEIKTKHHEKFARGFEQYLREGVAPSKELAGVFAKFKQWLLRLYETIRGLGAPISDDIRGVFDRMLAEEPSRTVIAPEMERQPTIYDIHETDAILTEPAEAAPAADRIAAERERAIAEVPGDIADEIQAEITSRTDGSGAVGEGPSGTGEMGGGGVKPEPVAQGGAMGAGDRAQRGGGSDVAPEGAGLFRGSDDIPLAPRPKPILGTVEPKFVDKAGNIRVENLTTSEDVANAIRESAIANDEFMGARRGVVSDGQVMDLASDIGLDGAFDLVSGWVKGRAYNAEQVMALRKLLVDSAQKVHAAMQKAATGSDQDVMAYAMARDRHQMIQRTVAGATAEAGRALRAFRDITVEAGGKEFNQKIKEATGKTLFQLRQEAQLGLAFDSPQQVSAFMQAAQKPNFLRMALEYFINNLISGVKSQLTYGVGGSVMSLQNFGPETAMAALIGAARKRMGREGETVRLGEVLAALKGAREGFAPALKAAGSAAKSGVSTLLPGEKAHLTPFETASEMIPRNTLDEAYKLNQVMPDLFGTLRGIREAVLATGAQLKAGGVAGAPLIGAAPSLRGDIPNIAVRGVTALPVGEAVRLPSRMNAVFDSFFRSLNYSMDKAAQAYRIAENEGLTGAKFDGRVAELLANPTPEMMETSRKTAGELTLLDKGGEFTRRVMQVFNTPVGGAPVLKFIAPFVRVAANTLDQTVIKRTPIGMLSAELRADLMGKNGTIAQDRAQARMVMGSALSMLFGSLAAEGLITGSGPTDPKEATVWRMAGHQPHSVKIGDMWYDVRGLGPLGMLSGIAADAYDVLQKVESDEEADKIAYSVMHAFAQNLLDQSFMKGPYDLLKAVDQPDRYGGSWVRNFASAFVPFSVGAGQVARSIDPYSREARTVIDAMKAKVPGLSQELMPRRDIFGEPIPNKEGAFGNMTTFYAQKAAADPVAVAMAAAKYFPGKVERKIRNVDLNDQQYDDYARIAGRMAKQRLDVLVNSADFERFPAHVRHDAIKAQIDASREVARNVVMMKYPQIVQDAMDAIRKERQRQ